MKEAQIILKITERCNLNCKYCYFFNCENQGYKNHQSVISKENILKVAKFIDRSIDDLELNHVYISLHGGEPLMMSKSRFRFIMDSLSSLKHKDKLSYSLQTNGTLIDKEWVDILDGYGIGIGISLDGPKHINNFNRIDQHGEGTYDQVLRGINLIKQKYSANGFSVFSVANLDFRATDVYQHIIKELEIERFEMLIPDISNDTKDLELLNNINNYLKEILDCWNKDKNKPRITFIKKIFNRLCVEKKEWLFSGYGNSIVVTINSDAKISPTDEVMNCDIDSFNQAKDIENISLKDYIDEDIVYNFNSKDLPKECMTCETKFSCNSYIMGLIPTQCQNCDFKFVCRGEGFGNIGNRYSKENGFDNPTVYCDIVKSLYSRAISILIKSGYSKEKLEQLFFIDDEKDHQTLCGRSIKDMLENEVG